MKLAEGLPEVADFSDCSEAAVAVRQDQIVPQSQEFTFFVIYERNLVSEKEWQQINAADKNVTLVCYGQIHYQAVTDDSIYVSSFGFVFRPATKWFGTEDTFYRGPAAYNARI